MVPIYQSLGIQAYYFEDPETLALLFCSNWIYPPLIAGLMFVLSLCTVFFSAQVAALVCYTQSAGGFGKLTHNQTHRQKIPFLILIFLDNMQEIVLSNIAVAKKH